MIKKSFIYLLIIILCPLVTKGQSNLLDLPKSPNSIIDSLPNGMHYIIHSTPDNYNKTEYRLVLNVGSLQEKDSEKGYAHFLEHMVFNGTTDFPDKKIVDSLQTLGYRFGRDINAYTTYDRTVYELSLLGNTHHEFGLTILENFLNKATLDSISITKEKRIVIQEINDFGQLSVFDKKKLDGTPYASRLPIATEKDIIRIDRNSLLQFYKKWYKPSLATIIVTGNFNPKEIEQKIKTIFNSDPKNPLNRWQNIHSFNPNFKSDFISEKNKTLTANELELIRFTPTPTITSKADYKQVIIEELYKQYLTQKLKEAQSTAKYHFTWYLSNQNENIFKITAKTKKELLNQVELLSAVSKNLFQKQFTSEKFEELKLKYLKQITHSEDEDDINYIGYQYIDQAAVRSNYIPRKEKKTLIKEVINEISLKEFQEYHHSLFDNNIKTLFLFSYNPEIFKLKNSKEILKAWKKGQKRFIEFKDIDSNRLEEIKSFKIDWKDLPKHQHTSQAKFVEEKYYKNINVTELRLSNGLRLAIKPTKSIDDVYFLTLLSRKGLNQLSVQEYPYYMEMPYFIDASWIKGLSYEDYLSLGAEKKISTIININNNATIINSFSQTGNTKDLFEWIFRKAFDYTKPTQDFEDFIDKQLDNSSKKKKNISSIHSLPYIQMRYLIASYKNKENKNLKELTTKEDWDKVNLDNFFKKFDSYIANPTDLYIVISGDFNIDDLKEKALHYFGGLPLQSIKDTVEVVKTPELYTPEITRKTVVDTEITRTEANLIFKGTISPNFRESIIAQIIRELFNTEFLNLSREQKGLVYSPYTDIEIQNYPTPKVFTTLNFTASPEHISILEKIAIEIATKLQKTAIDQALLNRIKRTIATNKALHLTENNTAVWSEKLREIYINFGSIEDFNNYDAILESITSKEIMEVAKTVLPTNNYGYFLITPSK